MAPPDRPDPSLPAGVDPSAKPAAAAAPNHPTREGNPAMFIWRNLDPKILARLLVQASAARREGKGATRIRREDRTDDRAPHPAAKRSDPQGGA